MTQLTVEIPSVHDIHLFRTIVEHLGFRVTQEIAKQPKEDLSHYKAVVARGIQRPLSHLQERLQQLEEDRKDRILPNR